MVFPLRKPVTTLGRSAANSLQIIDKRISRHHAEILFTDNHYIYRDLNSKNGSLVNGQPVKKAVILQHGDDIQVGDTMLVFELDPGEDQHRDASGAGVRLIEDDSMAFPRESVTVKEAPGASHPMDSAVRLRDAGHTVQQQQLDILYQVAEAIRSIFDPDQLFQTLMDILFKVMRADRGTILIRDRQTGVLVPRHTRRREGEADELQISRTIVERAIQDQAGLLISDALHDQRFAQSESIIAQDIRSALCAPMIYRDEVLGVIYIDTASRTNVYSKSDLALLTGICNQAAVALSNMELLHQVFRQKRLEREMEIAREIQMNLLPHVYPDVPGFEFSALSLPAKQVGGDYYDFIDLGEGRLGLCIADVSGKGVPAAIILSTMRTALKLLLEKSGEDLPAVMNRLNRIICRDTTEEMFVTMVLGILDSDARRFEYCNAGHCSPLMWQGGGVVELESNSPVVGIEEQSLFHTSRVTIQPGTLLVFTTDGVTDLMNPAGELFGKSALKSFVEQNALLAVRRFRDALYQRLLAHQGHAEQFDDLTILVVRHKIYE
ncbi:MAG: hypothetical protein Kow0059_14530 [Candidatus Sumerlaeia bacterium]